MNPLTAKMLKDMIDRKDDFVLINLLPEDSFEQGHIPTSHNVPLNNSTFTQDVSAIAGTKSRNVIVYAAGADLGVTTLAVETLRKAGFTNVVAYADGIIGWRTAGYELTTSVGAAS